MVRKSKVSKKQSPLRSKSVIISVIAMLILVVVLSVVLAQSKDYGEFARCLTDKGIVMAGTEWCPYCTQQKAMFKGSFEDVMMPNGGYVDCDAQPTWCEEKGVRGFPTWVLPDGVTVSGMQKLSTLEQVSGCPLP